ncbi:RNA-directed DNA methylation 4-like [Tasmannia lanceolata]|uniref:RNA-directed DNA methylation 4-like n=1 Tax=Tasmannia lanceolata TaxID=3420 RepID=UPI0040640473
MWYNFFSLFLLTFSFKFNSPAKTIRFFPCHLIFTTAELSECSSSLNSTNEKPVLVSVKRKPFQSRLDSFWLEINERPIKRPCLDFGKLSIFDSTGKEELKSKKLLVQHVETASSSENIKEILQSFMPNSTDENEFRRKIEERRRMFKQQNKQDHLWSVARLKHEDLVKSARFEQIWKSRRGNTETCHDDSVNEFCHLYDVVRVDVEEEASSKVQELESASLEDNAILCNYLPLIRDFLPTAAAEIESDMSTCSSKEDGYVYDLYTMGDDLTNAEEDHSTMYPLVQVDDDDYYDGPSQSEYETDDSNAEDNPLNDYPDEESSDDEEHGSRSSYDQSYEEFVDEDYWKPR